MLEKAKDCMKYLVLLCDGMADYKLPQLDNQTPMTKAHKPVMDKLAKSGYTGLIKTVAEGLKPGSDVANLSVIGYDPKIYYSGRSPLEAASIGIDLKETDVTLRCNLVTLSDDEDYEQKTIIDYCAGDIHTDEAKEIVEYLAKEFNNDKFKLYSGVSYRHCLVWANGTTELGEVTPPHDITGKKITDYLPKHPNAKELLDMMNKSYELLKDHPINKKRIEKGLNPANAVWFWGEGKKKSLMPFEEKYGLKGSMISAVDLLKGIGKLANMNVVEVDGATGYIDTNFAGKAQAAIDEFAKGQDFVYLHLEAPDECGHRYEIENKIKAIEMIDSLVLAPVLEALEKYDDYKVLILPDHATPLSTRTHAGDPVPFTIFHKSSPRQNNFECFDEESAKNTGIFINDGTAIIDIMKKL